MTDTLELNHTKGLEMKREKTYRQVGTCVNKTITSGGNENCATVSLITKHNKGVLFYCVTLICNCM